MKVALVDNMNNNFFALARYLRDAGIDAYVYDIPNVNMPHFKATADTFKSEEELAYVKKFPCDINNKSWVMFPWKKIRHEFKPYNLVISCGLSAAFLQRCGIDSDIIIPYGSDLYDLPFRRIKPEFSLNFIRSILWAHQAYFQKKAFTRTRVLISDTSYDLYRNALDSLNLQALNIGLPMLYNREELHHDENRNIWRFLDNHDFIVFNHSRQYWKSDHPSLNDYHIYGGLKRNDKVVRAFAEFIQNTKFSSPALILFEYGTDVDETKKLIMKLGIQNFVYWMPTMHRKHILYGLQKATFATNAFRENLLDIGGVCYESFAVGTPLINNCKEALDNPSHKFFRSPMIHALQVEEIVKIFQNYEKNPDIYRQIGQASKTWFDENLGIGLVKKYVKMIESMTQNPKLTQNDHQIREIFEDKA